MDISKSLGGGRLSFWIKAVAAVALTGIADQLFWVHQMLGSGLGGFALAWLAATVFVHPALRRDRRAIAAAGFALVYAAALADDPSLLAFMLFCAALGLAVLLPRAAGFDNALAWGGRLLFQALIAPLGPLLDLRRLRRVPRADGRPRLGASLAVLALPVIGGAIFLALFARANPLISNALSAISLPEMDEATILRVLFWLVLATLAWSTLRPRRPRWLKAATGNVSTTLLPGVSVASVTLSLIVFNLLFALQNGLDLAFLWSGAGLPPGVTLADYVHRGAYPLIATALLAGAFVLVALRPGSATADAQFVRKLVTLWVAQNIFLVASSVLRTLDYIDVFSLTRLRIAALAWMALVAVGLALILWRMLKAKSASWLINANATAAGIVLSLCTVIDLGSVAATWNVRHAREVGGKGAALDLCYLDRMGSSALTALAELEHRKLQPEFLERVTYVRRNVLWEARRDQNDGQWTWRNARRLERALAINGGKPWPRDADRAYDRGCDGRPAPLVVPTFTVDPPVPAAPAASPPSTLTPLTLTPLTPTPLTKAPQR